MLIRKIRAFYTLRKSKKVLRQLHCLYRKKGSQLESHLQEKFVSQFAYLQAAITHKHAEAAALSARQLQEMAHQIMPRSSWDKLRDFVVAISFALMVAIVIRQMWFELYTIPTGSMRPTLKESDFLVVSKTDFGLNIPLKTSHFYFDPSLVQRGSVFVFTSENLDVADSDTVYFYLFPGKKQFVKRLIGKPGDTLYFYGGKVYGIDAKGDEIKELRNSSWSQTLEHIPFIHFDGRVAVNGLQGQGIFSSVLFQQMNQPIAKLNVNSFGLIQEEMLPQNGRAALPHYSDLWGFKNYAMARLLTQQQVDQMHPGAGFGGLLYLELTHHPSLKEARLVRDEMNRMRPDLGTSVSLIALQQEHIDCIANNMTTCRFIVKKGMAYRLGFEGKDPVYSKYFPKMTDVPDGTYEIQDGKAYAVYWGGITKELPENHPLYRKDPERIQLLYNLGIEFLTQYQPNKQNRAYPSRYAYFRDQSLYLLGAPILKKDDPALISFLKTENDRQLASTSVHPYLPFEDMGAPMTQDGKIDVEFIKKYGLVIPEKMYLALGDNHAMSADSRQFGFVPEENLKGKVGFLFSPPGSRWGSLPQPTSSHSSFPTLFVWGTAIAITVGYSLVRRRSDAQRSLNLSS